MTECTRITKNSRTIIDYIITNNRNITAGINNANKIPDHEAIQIIIRSHYTTIGLISVGEYVE